MNRKTVKEILQFGFDETRALPTYEKVKERERVEDAFFKRCA